MIIFYCELTETYVNYQNFIHLKLILFTNYQHDVSRETLKAIKIIIILLSILKDN